METKMPAIVLTAKCCGRTMDYDRSIDPDIPPNVVRIEQKTCAVHWNGDFEDELWLDADGNEVPQSQ